MKKLDTVHIAIVVAMLLGASGCSIVYRQPTTSECVGIAIVDVNPCGERNEVRNLDGTFVELGPLVFGSGGLAHAVLSDNADLEILGGAEFGGTDGTTVTARRTIRSGQLSNESWEDGDSDE